MDMLAPIGMVILAQDGAAAATVPESVQVQNVLDFIQKGGIMMIPIGLCSFVALTVLVERFISLRRSARCAGHVFRGCTSMHARCRFRVQQLVENFPRGVLQVASRPGVLGSSRTRMDCAGSGKPLPDARLLEASAPVVFSTNHRCPTRRRNAACEGVHFAFGSMSG